MKNNPVYPTNQRSNKEPRDISNNGEEMHSDSQFAHILHNESCQEVVADSVGPSKYLTTFLEA